MATTMYFIGTDHHRDEPDQLFPWFYRELDPGAEGKKKFIYDGPGSKPMTRKNFFNVLSAKPAKIPVVGVGTSLGVGWEGNVAAAINDLRANANVQTNERINLIGHSRGAVTCNMVAHAIKKNFPQFRVRIFAIDPVPGGERDFASNIGDFETIPSNVYEYVQILMENHDAPLFGVLGPNRLKFEAPGRTSYRTLAMPGKHGSCVKCKFQEYPESQISCALISDWLVDGGVDCGYRLNASMISELYAIIFRKKKHDKNDLPSGKAWGLLGTAFVFGIPAGFVGGLISGSPTFGAALMTAPIMTLISSYWKNDRSADVPNSQRGEPFYINKHHKTALLLTPAWQAFVAALDSRYCQAHVDDALYGVYKQLPNTFDALRLLCEGSAGNARSPWVKPKR
jgi:hypothetical protein